MPRSPLSQNRALRRVFLPVFARINLGDIRIRHHWTGERVKLHSFRHKGYWFHGRDRERAIMLSLIRLVATNDVVYDVGGHIGYTALFLASLSQEVHVFEPGPNNLPYLHANVDSKPTIRVVESAVGADSGTSPMLIENLTGQNNTLLPSADTLRTTSRDAFTKARSRWEEVQVVTLDDYARSNPPPDVVKIDVEGYEFEVLQGALRLLRNNRPVLMVEVTRRYEEVTDLMTSLGYGVFSADLVDLGQVITTKRPNVFFLHRQEHGPLIGRYARPKDYPKV